MTEDVRYWIATAPVGASSVLAEELAHLGATDIKERSHDVKFQGTLEVGYRACLWSRAATRVLLSLGSIPADSTDHLYEAVRRRDWREHLRPGATLACDCTGGNAVIRHTIYGSQLLKDAVCDSLREATGERPSVQPERPDVLLHLHVEGPTALLSLDFSGESLHRRGYRIEGGRAPVKENVAAAVLLRAGWPGIHERGGTLLDPMCGSGTFLTEAALIAADAAPALDRDYFGFNGWRAHDAALWETLRSQARERRAARTPRRCIVGSDIDADSVRVALAHAAAAGLGEWIHVEKRALRDVTRPRGEPGLVVTNPPYGERLGTDSELRELYTELGSVLKERFSGWEAAVLTGNAPLGKALGLHAKRAHRFYNGAIECRLLRFDVNDASTPAPREEVRAAWSGRPGAQMFANRLAKNVQRLGEWAAREGIECYRVYDADMPEYAFAIDLYGAPHGHVYVQEYAPPKTVDLESARARRREALSVLPDVLGVPLERIHSRVRKPQKGDAQYEKRASGARAAARSAGRQGRGAGGLGRAAGGPGDDARLVVREAGLELWVNFRDYLDTGLFLDHRLVRARVRDAARDADFLNLFCYTGSATVYAAAGGARSTVSVDLSNTYLDWAHDNLRLNGFDDPRHELHRGDCLEWLAAREPEGARFDLILLDPPTFSNSKRMQGVLDVQRDHVGMIRRSMKLMRPAGTLVFSTNHRRFKLDAAALADLGVEDISAETIPLDFERNARIHRCFVIRHRPGEAGAP
ncbi:MAG TPA: bifunctional 23S rRNA (guanine(2069)-N(7))-methyltransferase RlmK/23S rRNA (guanine(2445)-N(2))-methyltransferase RlmL [Steroidobacteraceae bacterium]|nr:bifunctional 23S rRNA (guanine(2069)-N(7))-methyltransferase RlmK/23S rRNA (guanine(2445)-N(2))-methyltransferase RlmL [Steroidobacteraceae bacterium]